MEVLVMLPSFVLPIVGTAVLIYLAVAHRALARRVRDLEQAVADLARGR